MIYLYVVSICKKVIFLCKNIYKIPLREFRIRAHGRLFYKTNNDINGVEPSRRVSSLLKGFIRRQGNFVLLSEENCNLNNPPFLILSFLCLLVQYCSYKFFTLHLPITSIYCLLKTVKIYHCYKVTAEIHYLLPKSKG